MRKKISIRTLLVAVLSLISGAAWAGTTQVVVQWVGKDWSGLSGEQIFDVQGKLDDLGTKYGFDSDGNDVGGGAANFYLYVDDKRVDQVVREIVDTQKKGLLPDGMRIGIAVYKDKARKDWVYKVAYPNTLKHFDITYHEKN
jgi:hypothetical protein